MRRFAIIFVYLTTVTAWAQLQTDLPCRDLGRGEIDEGCNETYSVCVHANGGEVIDRLAGHHCAYCINSVQPNRVEQVAPDDGCDASARVCVGARELAADVEGTSCAVCYNSIPTDLSPNVMDDGCPPSAPVCVNDAGESPPLRTPGTACVANCFDTSRTGTDEGVSSCCVYTVSSAMECASSHCFKCSALKLIRFAHWRMDRIQARIILECVV